MKTIQVFLKDNPYQIIVGNRVLPQLGRYLDKSIVGQDAVVITNPVVHRHYGKIVTDSLKKSGFSVKALKVPDGEKSKSAKVAIELLEKIAAYDAMKKIFVVALGGGVIGDLAGYVAAVYRRGVPYVQVPTTFLAQIDSAIGGKTGIDLSVGKNLVGAFYQPKLVFSDIAVLATLSKRQLRNGMAEAVKYGVIYDSQLFRYLEANYEGVLKCSPSVLEKVVARCSRIKRDVVLADEKETKGIRTILNFGHTVGHAIEAAGGYRFYHHGEAIALGMRIAADMAFQLGMVNTASILRINALLTRIGLPERIKKVQMADILKIMRHDKKFLRGKNRFVLPTSIGRVTLVDGVALPVIKQAIAAYM